MQDWLNRIGLTLQFVALFLVTPEILGKERVSRLTSITFIRPSSIVSILLIRHPVLRELGGVLLAVVIVLTLQLLGLNLGSGLVQAIGLVLVAVVGYSIGRWKRAIARIFMKVAESETNFLSIGALMFAIGFVFLMWATFVHAA